MAKRAARVRGFQLAALALVLPLFLACYGPPPVPRFAGGEPVSVSGTELGRLANSSFQHAWARPGARFGHYHSLLVRYGRFDYRNPPRQLARRGRSDLGNYALERDVFDRMANWVPEIFDGELLWGHLDSAEEPGEGVLALHVSVGRLVIAKPLSSTSSGDSAIAASLGSVGLQAELRDSVSGELLAAVAERRPIESGTRRPIQVSGGAALYEVKRLYESWARRLKGFLEVLPTLDPVQHVSDAQSD